MPHKKKKFIDKKHAITFHLVHRSQQDPLQACDEAPQWVFMEEKEKRKEEQKKYGIYFHDDYNYLQHLKDVNEIWKMKDVERFSIPCKSSSKIQLPSTVFESHVETTVGLLNKGIPLKGPQLDWDPDIVAALDEDFNFDDPKNLLDDDFISKANATVDEQETCKSDDNEIGSDFASDEADISDSDGEYGDNRFMEEETKTLFTNYSLSSSVLKRNNGLCLLDDRFEKLFEEYDNSEIGALDDEDVDGHLEQESDVLHQILEEYMNKKEPTVDLGKEQVIYEENDSESDQNMEKIEIEGNEEKWDCESILSTYSNLYNRPELIVEPKKEKKIHLNRLGIPAERVYKRGFTQKDLEKEMGSSVKSCMHSHIRDESKDDKKIRKIAVKQERRERRVEKKANKVAFRVEKIRQDKEMVNIRNNLKGIRL